MHVLYHFTANTLMLLLADLVWEGISDNLNIVAATWWENERVQTQLSGFRRALYVPIAKRLGFDYKDDEGPDVTQLRTIAVGGAALAGDKVVLAELKARFAKYAAGDESAVPSDLLGATFTQVVKYGGKEEYDAVLKVYEAGKGPSVHIASMFVERSLSRRACTNVVAAEH